jgi:hypothetical protein
MYARVLSNFDQQESAKSSGVSAVDAQLRHKHKVLSPLRDSVCPQSGMLSWDYQGSLRPCMIYGPAATMRGSCSVSLCPHVQRCFDSVARQCITYRGLRRNIPGVAPRPCDLDNIEVGGVIITSSPSQEMMIGVCHLTAHCTGMMVDNTRR